MVTNCPIYQNKAVLCDLASPLLCVHQYIRKQTWTAVWFGATWRLEQWGSAKARWGPGLGQCHVLLYPTLSRKAQLPAQLDSPRQWISSRRGSPSTDLALRAVLLFPINVFTGSRGAAVSTTRGSLRTLPAALGQEPSGGSGASACSSSEGSGSKESWWVACAGLRSRAVARLDTKPALAGNKPQPWGSEGNQPCLSWWWAGGALERRGPNALGPFGPDTSTCLC